jgi:hypothetical protein
MLVHGVNPLFLRMAPSPTHESGALLATTLLGKGLFDGNPFALIAAWSRHGCELGFGIGIAQGYATLGQIGFSERSGYTAIGLCGRGFRFTATYAAADISGRFPSAPISSNVSTSRNGAPRTLHPM